MSIGSNKVEECTVITMDNCHIGVGECFWQYPDTYGYISLVRIVRSGITEDTTCYVKGGDISWIMADTYYEN